MLEDDESGGHPNRRETTLVIDKQEAPGSGGPLKCDITPGIGFSPIPIATLS